jgi:uncharacterized protein (TIGR02145 family)
VSCAIKGKSGGSVVQHHIELPCNECFWNGDTSVVINGVTWATRNVDAPGTFAARPESYGMHYQWNRSTGWYDNAGTLIGVLKGGGTTATWNTSVPSGTTWESANDPSPAGWRVPTYDELSSLLKTANVSKKWTACNGVNGYLFTDKTTGKSLFLPAAGYRDYTDGTLYNARTYGYCWSNTSSSNYARNLTFYSSLAYMGNSDNRLGMSVRCVRK